MMHLAWPWMALLLPLPWLRYVLSSPAQPRGAAIFMPMAASLAGSDARPTSRPAGYGRLVFAAIWLLLVAAAMRPQWLGDPVPLPTTGRRLMLAVDVSGSMATEDMSGGATRLRVVQSVAGHFIDGRRGDRVGLILFGTQPYLQAPLTADINTVHRFLNEAVVGVAGTETAIGDAIGLAIKRLRAETSESRAGPGQTVLILLTDGENDAGVMPPLEAARLAAQSGLRIYTIGVGAAPESGFFAMGGGNTDLDEDTLKAIAKETGGQYFRATDAAALQDVYREIDRLEPAKGTRQWLRPADEWFTWPLTAALLLSVPAAVVGGRRA